MESAVTKLLVATRQLLESLQMWSVMKMSDLEVSDTYVKLGNDFNNAVGAFVQNGVAMDDLLSVPQDLRECLESLLALDPTPENLDIYLPRVRQIIVTLLSGLKAKQAVYRRIVPGAGGRESTVSTASSSAAPRREPDTRQVLLARAEGRPSPEMAFRNPFSGQSEPREAGRSSNGRSMNTQESTSNAGRKSPDPTRRYSNLLHQQQRQQQQQRQSGAVPPRPDLPPPGQMIFSSSSTSTHGSTTHADRHLSSTSTTNGTTTRSRSNAPLPPAPPDAFRPPRRRVTPSDTSASRSVTPTPPMPYEPVFNDPPAEQPPSIPTRSVERERYALRDEPSVPRPTTSTTRTLPDIPFTSGEPKTPPRRRSHVSKRNSGGSAEGSVSSRRRGSVEDRGNGDVPGISRFSLDSEVTETPPKSRKRAISGEEDGKPVLPPLSGLPSLEEGLSVDTTSKVRSGRSVTPTQNPPAADPAPATAATSTESPAALASLTALQNSEALGRRASKRFSQYQYKQLLPGHHKGPSVSSMRHGRMDSLVEGSTSAEKIPPLPPVPAGAQSPVRPPARRVASKAGVPPVPPIPDILKSKSDENVEAERMGQDLQTAVPTIVTPDSDSDSTSRAMSTPEPAANDAVASPETESTPGTFRVFLQYGRETKKIVLDRLEVTSIADLQGLFMTKFEYAPEAREMFPDVYIKDPVTGIAYHLEDMDDVKPDVLLSLNIDQLDQVKQHFDSTISGLLHEIKELKNNVAQNRRLSAFKPEHSTLSPSMHPADRPSFRSPAPKSFTLSRPSSPVPMAIALPDSAPLTGPDLHAQLDDVQSLRRELGIMRQQYVDFVNQSKTAFSTIRDQTQTMREISTTKLSGSRSLLNNGKHALENDSSEVVRAVEEVSDAIDAVKDDVVRRQILPPPNRMETMKKNLEEAKAYVEKLKQQVSLVAPAWKATWNEELSTVLEEQRLLKYHESLANDLEGDITQASGIFATLQEYMAQRQQGLGMTRRQFRQPTRAPETTVPNLLLEIRTQEADPNRRLRAIEEQQKAREREKAAKADDEFSTELTGFVAGRKLKKTGGTEEAERMRMRKQELSFKKMFDGKKEVKQEGDVGSPVTPTMGKEGPNEPIGQVKETVAETSEVKQEADATSEIKQEAE